MELSRRDAVAALAAVGAAGAGGVALDRALEEPGGVEEATVETLVAAAEALYPTAVDGVDEFVRAFVDGRLDDDDRAAGYRGATDHLDRHARAWHDRQFRELSVERRREALSEMGADAADPDPDPAGGEPGRVRYYVVNELLFALYASPTGAELVGLENPQGHPGGTDSYRRGPRS
jgi:hypothetical protein